MNSSLLLRVQGAHNHLSNQQPPTSYAASLDLLKRVAADTNLASDFSKICVIHEFQLGDHLTRYHPNSEFFYFVCQGRVRLLGFDATLGRSVSTQLLLEQQTFGADHLFCHQPLPYQPISASAGFVAYIRLSDLMPWLHQIPQLEEHLQRMTDERQALIFFKTTTELRLHKSNTLRQLLPYLVHTKISADSALPIVAPPHEGRYWLASGKVCVSKTDIQPLSIGESWGYPDVTLLDWTAQTDLHVYHLPIKHWELATAIAPELFPQSTQDSAKPKNQPLPQPPQLPSLPLSPTPIPSLHLDADFEQRTHQFWSIALLRRIPFIQQQSSSDCGAASLAMISAYWGKRLSLNTLRNLARTDRMGASLQALADAAQALGYEALPVRASLSKMESQMNPWIAHWQGIHYVVVWKVKGDRVLICDPAVGKQSLTRQEFEASWTGYALLLTPTERLKTVKSEKISPRYLWHVFWRHHNPIGRIILASVLLSVFGLATPVFTQVILDQVIPQKNLIALNIFAAGFLLFGIWHIALSAVRQYLLDYFSNRMELVSIGGFMSHLLRLPLQFFGARQVGDIVTRIQENRKIQQFLSRQAVSTILDSLMAFVYLGLMACYNLHLTFLVLGLILPIVIFTVGASSFLKGVSRKTFKEAGEQNTSMVEMVTGIATVKTAAAETGVRWRWEERFTKMLRTRFRGQKLANIFHMTSQLINHIGTTIVLWYGTTRVIRGDMSLGELVAFNLLIGNIINPVLSLVNLWDEFQEIEVSLERLNDVLTAQPEENSQTPLLVLPPIRGDVYFENVCFRYNQDEKSNTLQNISFRVKAGQTIGIVGSSGSGKSTLVNLLAGLYSPHTGQILIDGYDIAHVSPRSLRSQLGVVPQECFLFSGTILENITLYRSEYSLEQAIAAAKLAEAHAFIQALPLGYNTQVGERGTILSGGQRQRIAIARALIGNPRILILDEATSSLDAESEHRIQQNLARLTSVNVATSHIAPTIFIIAHRFSAVRHADHIFVLDRGIIVEQGNHDELMTINGFYHHLAHLQF